MKSTNKKYTKKCNGKQQRPLYAVDSVREIGQLDEDLNVATEILF